MKNYDEIKRLIDANNTEEAIARLDLIISEGGADDTAYYLRGNAHRKHNNWKNAMSDYCKAMEINPQSPAADAYKAAVEILDFFNKDLLTP